MTIAYDANTIYVYRGQARKRTVYVDEDELTRLSVNWSNWLGTATISSSTWSVEDGNSLLTLSTPTADTVGTQTFVAASERGIAIYVKNVIVSSAGETATQSIKVVSDRIA